MAKAIPLSSELRRVVEECFVIANDAGESCDSSHMLMAFFTEPCAAQSILLGHGLDEDRVVKLAKTQRGESRRVLDRIMEVAHSLAWRMGSARLTTAHMLMAMGRERECRASKILEDAGLSLARINSDAVAHLVSPSCRKTALQRLRARGRAAHVLATRLGREGSNPYSVQPTRQSVPEVSVKDAVAESPEYEPYEEAGTTDDEMDAVEQYEAKKAGGAIGPFELDPAEFPTLSKLGRNLTYEASRGRLDPLVGREEMLERVAEILSKRRSNNPLLLGEPGVGKTAIVEGLARLAVECGDDFPALKDRIVVSISASELVAGTGMRGSFAERLQGLRREMCRAEGRVVLFIDEIHTLIGLGTGDGALDAANDLKGALARGEFPCIGATTFAEYERLIRSDGALSRRFETVVVNEASVEETLAILEGIRHVYEAHHGVRYTREALERIVKLSDTFIVHKCMPAKAIDLMDWCGARARRERSPYVRPMHVVSVISASMDIPEVLLNQDGGQALEVVTRRLQARVFGQGRVVDELARCIARRVERRDSRGPLASLLLAGPEGSGRRAAARALAESLFGKVDAVEEIPLAAYAESHTVSALLGAPPGYVGHSEGGLLASVLVRKPFVVLVWSDIDKAHKSILDFLVQVLDQGVVTDRRGRKLDFRNVVHLLLPSAEIVAKLVSRVSVGFGQSQSVVKDMHSRLADWLPKALLEEVDGLVLFGRPTRDALVRDVQGQLLRLVNSACKKTGVSVTVEDEYAEKLVSHAQDRVDVIGRLMEATENTLRAVQHMDEGVCLTLTLDADGRPSLVATDGQVPG